MSENRVIVVVTKNKGEVIGVFTDENAYEVWLETSKWKESQINVRNCRVRDMDTS